MSHHKYGPSSLKWREICPGWDNEPQPSEGGSIAALEGTMMHKALETGNYEGLDEWQKKNVLMVADVFQQMKNELGEIIADLPEVQLQIAEGKTFGTADIVLIGKGKAKIGDAKFGWHAVDDAEENIQGWAYAVGVFEKWKDVDEVEVVFAQPRINMISRHTFSRDKDYDRLRLRVETIIARAQQPEPELNPTEKGCLYCGNKGTCKALHSKALIIGKGYDMLRDAELPVLADPLTLATPDQRSQAESIRRVMERWCDSVKKSNMDFRMSGGDIPGYELKTRAGKKEIVDATQTYDIIKDKLTPEQFSACATISWSKLEKAYAESFPRGQKQQAKQALEDKLNEANLLKGGGEVTYLAKTKETN